MNFNDFTLSAETKKAIAELEFTEATDIQEKSIPLILEGKDIIGFSQTGSGKTAAYGLPAIESVDPTLNAKYPQVLILSPTRELSMQVTDELHKFSKYKPRIRVVPVYGGQPINIQVGLVRSGCQIVVGTPGRIMDLLRRGVLDFSQIKTVILDEADEMLNMGFREDIEIILSSTPDERQTLLFSATMPKAIIEITGKFQKDPVMVQIKSSQMTGSNIEQSFFEVAKGRKQDALSLLIQYYQPRLCLVFCNTKKMVDELTDDLKKRGFSAEGLHGDMKQMNRTHIMNRFKNGGFDILIATDVAARGIDVNNIDIVFNYDLPDDCEYYIHRIGRTARGGKDGKSFTLIHGAKQYADLQQIIRYTKSTITKRSLPTVSMIKQQIASQFLEEIRTFIAGTDCSEYSKYLNELKETGLSDCDISSALLKMFLDERSIKSGTVDVPPEPTRESSFARQNDRRDSRRPARTPNEKATEKFKDVDMVKVTISIGRKDKVAPKHILGAVAGESGLPGSIMGSIDIKSNVTTIDVPKKYKTRIVKALNRKTIKDKVVMVK